MMNFLWYLKNKKLPENKIKVPEFDTYHLSFLEIMEIWKIEILKLKHTQTIFDRIIKNEVTLSKEYETQHNVVIKPNRTTSWIIDSTKARTSLEHFLVLPKSKKPIINSVNMTYQDLIYLNDTMDIFKNHKSKYTLEYIKKWFNEHEIDLVESIIFDTLHKDSILGGWDLCRESAEYITKCIINDYPIEHEYIYGVHCYPYYSVGSLHIHVINKAFVTNAGKGILLKTTPIDEIYMYFNKLKEETPYNDLD